MKREWAAFACGMLFAIGLGISGMTQPAKVTAFLDFAGVWDPSLLFVMGGAVLVYAIGYRLTVARQHPWLDTGFRLPAGGSIDRKLVAGAAVFGIGWGLAGFCPGPALTSVVSLQTAPLLFTAAMLVGMALYEWNARA